MLDVVAHELRGRANLRQEENEAWEERRRAEERCDPSDLAAERGFLYDDSEGDD